MASRRVYLDNIPVSQAWDRWLAVLDTAAIPAESIPPVEAVGRVLDRPAVALRSYPHYHAAAVDGYAVRAADTGGASEHTPVWLAVPPAAEPVDTGMPLPVGKDAVVMIEQVREHNQGIEVLEALPPWRHVRPLGEDVVAGEVVLPAGSRVRAVDLAALLAAGVTRLWVRARPRVAIIASGDELVPLEAEPQPGQVVEFNSQVLATLVREWGGEPLVQAPVGDQPSELGRALEEALEQADVAVINAGSSAGRKDYTAGLLEEMGKLAVHGVGIRPGKPTVLGSVRGRPVLGLPGYPVSAVVAARVFLQPLVERLLQISPAPGESLQASMARPLPSALGSEEHLRVRVAPVGNRYLAAPLSRGAAATRSLAQADGLVVIPAFSEGLEAGETVEVQLLRSREEIRRNILVTGSHDLTLDLLAGEMKTGRGVNLAPASVGSLGGLAALRREEAHAAGIHLLDPESGDYNVPYVRRYLPRRPVALVTLALRDQGLLLPPGNPRGIRGLQDLCRPQLRFLNRQRGSGTRILLDYLLAQEGISALELPGYQSEAFTHMEVAAAVASGQADAGMGIFAAARALGLDFVPLARERYELAVPEERWQEDGLEALRQALASASFRRQVEELGGYHLSESGSVRWVKAIAIGGEDGGEER